MKVPFLDLKAQYNPLSDEIEKAVKQVMERTAFSGGPFVSQFEEQFADFCGARHAVGVGSGTDALLLALLAVGVGPGDEVITVPNTFIATTEAISFCGARPVFVDVDEQSQTLDPKLLEAAISGRTKAIIPVHLFGQPADLDPIMRIARQKGLVVIEDCCQAHGALYKGKPVGSIGDAGCFSFYPGKNLGAYGEAGAIVTNSPEVNDKARMLRDHGQSQRYTHVAIGLNARMDGMQGAILSVKLKHLHIWNELRRRNSHIYNALLSSVPEVAMLAEMDYAKHVYHIYAVRVQNRDLLLTTLGEKGVGCGIHYPVPIHLQGAYAFLGHGRGSFPVAEQCADELISLPMYAELTVEQIQHVVAVIKDFHAVAAPVGREQESVSHAMA